MRKVLKDALKGYQNLDLDVKDYTFTPPFMPLCHRWDTLKHFRQEAKEPVLKHAASELVDFLTPIVASSVASIAHTRETGKVAFADIWQIFAPNTLVSTKFYGVQTTCCVTEYEEIIPPTPRKPPSWKISMKFTDWNGETAGFSSTSMTINFYDGYRRVNSLPVFSISFLEDEESYKASMIARGKVFEQLRGYYFMNANGIKISVEGDTPVRRPITSKTTAKGPVERVENLQPLTDEQRLLATPWVRGFDLKSKQWCELCVDELRPMTWNDEAFDKLVLPGDEKQLAWEFVEAKSLSQSEKFDDFIPDKGRGLIILMFGPPGVGKTFTAEAVADKSRVPLYAMSAAELGTAPDTVEKALENALGLCRMWNAMLLLDEADVFLGARTSDSIARNELVAIFLRMLEYYQGTMFLTTNRIASIDPAFQSRIDLFLPYHDLSSEARREVWCNFIERAGQDKFDVTNESLHKLSQLSLNGREIKNLIKSAQLLSFKSGSKVPMERVYMLAERRVQALAEAGKSD
ncbi:P-loop containing nucleoside triphosphate hydrolase protein [Ustulina deusta]|nr:P-loop containing nucleoside triphosphate hydrolase protein [Ustulina deusta]